MNYRSKNSWKKAKKIVLISSGPKIRVNLMKVWCQCNEHLAYYNFMIVATFDLSH